MLEIQGKIHDRYTLEFKVGYSRYSTSAAVSEFVMDTWIFIPDSLYINAKTYPKSNFYRDFRALVRLMTPAYTLDEVADDGALPLSRLRLCCRALAGGQTEESEKSYEHQIKMFCSIVRSALRTATEALLHEADETAFGEQLEKMVAVVSRIMEAYRAIPRDTGLDGVAFEVRKRYDLGEEYLCRVAHVHLFHLMEHARNRFPDAYPRVVEKAAAYVDSDLDYQRGRNFLLPEEGCAERNRDFLHRAGQLKKYVESDLYVLADKKSNTFVWQQVFFMLAAGLSMVFATVVSFSFQRTYGNFTMPLFIALVVSYMFKDRIKDLMHYWFANKLGSKFYDYKIKLVVHGEPVGWGKEGCDFVNEEKLPVEIRARRGRVSDLEAGHSALREAVLVYRRRISIWNKRLEALSHYPLQGFNDIIRVNLRDFLRRMDSPHVPVYINEGRGEFHAEAAEKVYYVHFIIRYRYQGKTGYRRFRVCLTRRGVKELMEW